MKFRGVRAKKCAGCGTLARGRVEAKRLLDQPPGVPAVLPLLSRSGYAQAAFVSSKSNASTLRLRRRVRRFVASLPLASIRGQTILSRDAILWLYVKHSLPSGKTTTHTACPCASLLPQSLRSHSPSVLAPKQFGPHGTEGFSGRVKYVDLRNSCASISSDVFFIFIFVWVCLGLRLSFCGSGVLEFTYWSLLGCLSFWSYWSL